MNILSDIDIEGLMRNIRNKFMEQSMVRDNAWIIMRMISNILRIRKKYKYYLIVDILDYADRHNISLSSDEMYDKILRAFELKENDLFFYLLRRYPANREHIIRYINNPLNNGEKKNSELYELFRIRGDHRWIINVINEDKINRRNFRDSQRMIGEELSYMPPIRRSDDIVVFPGGSEYMRSNESFSKGLSGGFGRRRSRGW